jgi:hypothetical protein
MLGRGHDLKVDEGLVHTITPWLAGTQVVLDFYDDYEGYHDVVPAFDESSYWFSLYLDFTRISVDEARSLLKGLPRLPHILELVGLEGITLDAVLRNLPAGVACVEAHVSPTVSLPTPTPMPILLNTDALHSQDGPWPDLDVQGFRGVSFNRVVRPRSPFELDYDVCEEYLRALGYEC